MRISLIFRFLFDKNIPLKEKWWIILPAIYILSPIDLIPFPILGFSIIDDLVVFLFLLSMVKSKTQKYYGTEKRDNFKDEVKDKVIIEDVEYKVDEDKDYKDDK